MLVLKAPLTIILGIIPKRLILRTLSNETLSNTTLLSSSSSPPISLATSSTRSRPLTTEAFSEISSAAVALASSFSTPIHATSSPSSSLSSRSSTSFSTTRHSLPSEVSSFATSSSTRGRSSTPVGPTGVSSVVVASMNDLTLSTHVSSSVSISNGSSESSSGSIHELKKLVRIEGYS